MKRKKKLSVEVEISQIIKKYDLPPNVFTKMRVAYFMKCFLDMGIKPKPRDIATLVRDEHEAIVDAFLNDSWKKPKRRKLSRR